MPTSLSKALTTLVSRSIRSSSSKTKASSILPVINFQSEPPLFNRSVYAAIKSHGAFVLNNLGSDFSSAVKGLFMSNEEFLRQSEDLKDAFKGDTDSFNLFGYFPYPNFFAGSKSCHRHFIGQNNRGAILQALPPSASGKLDMRSAVHQLFPYSKKIFTLTVHALQIGLGLQQAELSKVFFKHSILLGVDSYLPVTQEKLSFWLEQKKLTKTPDGRIESFMPHKDLSPLTMLIYNNNQTHGLELKVPDAAGNLSFKPLSLSTDHPNELEVIVLSGLFVEVFTNKIIQGAEHRVVAQPLLSGQSYQRQVISSFVVLNPEVVTEFSPIVTTPAGPHFASQSMSAFFEKHAQKYTAQIAERAQTSLTAADLAPFPKEDEIESSQTPEGISFRRK